MSFISAIKSFLQSNKKEKNLENKEKENFSVDRAIWQWDTTCEIYCKKNHRKLKDLSDDEIDLIWEYSANIISIFLTWLIDNDFLSDIHKDLEKDIQMVKERKMTGYEYLLNNCELSLTREDISENIIDFVDEYYNYDDNFSYIDDYCSYVEDILKKEVFETKFSWDDYYKIKENVIDVAYKKFLDKKDINSGENNEG